MCKVPDTPIISQKSSLTELRKSERGVAFCKKYESRQVVNWTLPVLCGILFCLILNASYHHISIVIIVAITTYSTIFHT